MGDAAFGRVGNAMNPLINQEELKRITDKYRQLIADVADHGNDAEYQRYNHPTQFTRSNINGYFGELEKELLSLLSAQQRALLDRIGEPGLGAFEFSTASYDDVIKTIRWYKNRIKELREGLR